MTTKDKNEKGFVDFTAQQTAYLDVYKLRGELEHITEKLCIMEIPEPVVDALQIAINNAKKAQTLLWRIIEGEDII